MSTLVGEIGLTRNADGKVAAAQIYCGLHERHLRDHELNWRPPMRQAAIDARTRCTPPNGNVDIALFRKELARLRLEDFAWDWRKLHGIYASDPGSALFAIECDGNTQGLMLVETLNHATRLDPKGQNLAYVELLTSAPWNRGTFMGDPRFGQTGYALINIAINVSQDKQFGGRIALHSVSGSVSFYSKCGMTHLGPDPHKQGLDYFEISSQQALAFTTQIAARRGGP